MKKISSILLIVGIAFLVFPNSSFAQMGMMGGYAGQPTPSQSDLQEEQSMQDAGQKIYQNLQNKKITCANLTPDDYEKLGEYYMGLSAGNTQNHVYWDQRIQEMMGDAGDTQMHIVWGERESRCQSNAAIPSNTPSFVTSMMGNYSEGGVFPMMGLWGGYGYQNMVNSGFGWGLGIVGFLFWLVLFVDLVLLGIFLWKKIKK